MATSHNLRLMVVHAHPDDEVIGTGGTLLRYAEEGASTVLVCCTLGEEGEIHDPELDPVEAKPRLGAIREGELRKAASILQIGSVELLGYRDSGMAGRPENDNPACFHQADLTEATARLVRLIRRHRPQVLMSYDDFGGYGHPDHKMAHLVTREAFARAADPEFAPTPNLEPWQPLKLYEFGMVREMMHLWRDRAREEREERAAEAAANGTAAPNDDAQQSDGAWTKEFFEELERHSIPLAEVTTSIDVARYRERTLDALRCHRTQIPEDSDFYRERNNIPTELRDFQHFRLVKSLVKSPAKEDDVFAGLR